MKANSKTLLLDDLNQQGADALLEAVFNFLKHNELLTSPISRCLQKHHNGRKHRRSRKYEAILNAYEEMGVICATWFSDPRFLDDAGHPVSLSIKDGTRSVASLIRISRAKITTKLALDLMKLSPSIEFTSTNRVLTLRRVFVLPGFEVLRAAFLVRRFLETVAGNASALGKNTTMLLERSCHVSTVDLSKMVPMIRDIESRGTAFMDSVDGEIESRRLRRSKASDLGELGVSVFAWANTRRRSVP